MKTWDAPDDRLLGEDQVCAANGVPLVEFDDRSQSTVPGQLVSQWGPGNWSGSEEMKLRTMRAGAALQSNGKKLFLIYAVFSDATPSAMARVFQAYRCRYGMHLDMNALEHTYLALYRRSGSQLFVDHLIDGMSEVDQTASGGNSSPFSRLSGQQGFLFRNATQPVTKGRNDETAPCIVLGTIDCSRCCFGSGRLALRSVASARATE